MRRSRQYSAMSSRTFAMATCVDTPRSGFVDLFATHPPIDKRIKALIDFAGGHDPGPIALPAPAESADEQGSLAQSAAESSDKFLPERPPIELGKPQISTDEPGPWGERRN